MKIKKFSVAISAAAAIAMTAFAFIGAASISTANVASAAPQIENVAALNVTEQPPPILKS